MKYPLTCSILMSCLFLGAAHAQPQQQPIIDMHMHTHSSVEVPAGVPALCRPEPCKGKGSSLATSKESLDATLAEMRRYNIVKGFLSGPDPMEVQQWAAAGGDRFLASAFIFKPGMSALDTLRPKYEAGELSGMGEIATQLNGIKPNDPALEPYFAFAEERDLPVLIHTLGIGPYLPGFRSAAGNPILLEDVLIRHPRLRLYVENAGFPYSGEIIAMMYQYPQLYADVSTITWVIPRQAFYDYLKTLVDAGLGKRLMFGSDQMRWPEAIGWAVQAIKEAPFLSAEEKRDIFYNNAARFLRLKGASH